jgi:uncharacterized membrane protein
LPPLGISLLTLLPSIGNCPSGTYYSNGYCYSNSGWYFWGRWLFAGIVILFVIAAIILLG